MLVARPRHLRALTIPLLSCLLLPACAIDFDTDNHHGPRGSLGREIYTILCDRVGAQALREDLTGASFHAVCHPSSQGQYADAVDVSALPPIVGTAKDTSGNDVSPEQQAAYRAYRIARIEALGRHREELIVAFDAILPDVEFQPIDGADPSCSNASANGGPELSFVDEAADTASRMVPLYNDDTIPSFTRGVGELLAEVEADPEATDALAQIATRHGYRPIPFAVGVLGPILSYPRLPALAQATLGLLAGPNALDPDEPAPTIPTVDGVARPEFETLLSALHLELRNLQLDPDPPILQNTDDPKVPGRTILSRPRTALEFAESLLFAESSTYAQGAAQRYAVARDSRGVALVASDPGGGLPGPFVDNTGPNGVPDGLPDLDPLGRFVTQTGTPALTPLPTTAAPGQFRDSAGRALGASGAPLYVFRDVNATFAAAFLRDVKAWFNADPATASDTVMNFVAGVPPVLGPRDPTPVTQKTYADGGALAAGGPATLTYRSFHGQDSAVVDLAYALGQMFARPEFDDLLALLQKLLEEQPAVAARLVHALLDLKAVADQHPEAHVPQDSTLWDDLLEPLTAIVAQQDRERAQAPGQRGLVENIMLALDADATMDLEPLVADLLTYRDQFSYDANQLNGPPLNVTAPGATGSVTPVDRLQSDAGLNKSQAQSLISLLHDATGLGVCTKKGAVAHLQIKTANVAKALGIDLGVFGGLLPTVNGPLLDYPGPVMSPLCNFFVGRGIDFTQYELPECGILRIQSVAALILPVAAGRATLDVPDPCLQRVVSFVDTTGTGNVANQVLQDSSGIDGFSLSPTVNGVDRIAWFKVPYDAPVGGVPTGQLPGETNPATNQTKGFLADVIDPIASMVCPADAARSAQPLPAAVGMTLRTCMTVDDTLRGRDPAGLFALEQNSGAFLKAVQPLANAFLGPDPLPSARDGLAELVALIDKLAIHWGSSALSTAECDPTAPKTDARYCTRDGAVTYEALVADQLRTRALFATLRQTVHTLHGMTILHCAAIDPVTHACTQTQSRDGVEVIARAAGMLMDPAEWQGLKDRQGHSYAVRNDGGLVAQTTPLLLMLDALKKIDAQFAQFQDGSERHARWHAARSHIVDQLFSVEGAYGSDRFANPTIPVVLPQLIGLLRAQIAASCATTAAGAPCTWATATIPQRLADWISGPLMAGVVDLLDVVRQDPAARAELAQFASYLLDPSSEVHTVSVMGLVDVLQLLHDNTTVGAALRIASDAVRPPARDPQGRVVSRGALDAGIIALNRIFNRVDATGATAACGGAIDPNGTIPLVLQHLMAPMTVDGRTPLDAFVDAVGDVNRADPSSSEAYTSIDFTNMAHELGDFVRNKDNGMEQVYAIIRQATQ